LLFDENRVFIDSEAWALPISCLDLSLEIEKFKEGVAWKVRVLSYDEEDCELRTEIIDYHAMPEKNDAVQASLQFLIIDKIKFRAVDTSNLLRAIELKPLEVMQKVSEPTINFKVSETINKEPAEPVKKMFSKTINVQFNDIHFLEACISFSYYVDALRQNVKFEIENPDIRPEFEAIRDYFIKILKKKVITADVKIQYTDKDIISVSANSPDIDKINSSIIDSVRFAFVKKEILGYKGKQDNSPLLQTLDNLARDENMTGLRMFKSDQDLIEDILNIKNSKHYHHLKYLASQHLSSVLKIRFIFNPFSFIFLLEGEMKYHVIWETLNSEEATYIWHFEKSMESLRKGLREIEIILIEIKATSKLDYLRKEHDNFSRVIHNYAEAKSGFTAWKGTLEQMLD